MCLMSEKKTSGFKITNLAPAFLQACCYGTNISSYHLNRPNWFVDIEKGVTPHSISTTPAVPILLPAINYQ
jgi:hypothetical protein